MLETELTELIAQNKWSLIVATLMFLLLRALARDVTWFPTLPEVITIPYLGWRIRSGRLKPWLNVLVAVLGATIDRVRLGKSWSESIRAAVIVSVLPIAVYELGLLKPTKTSRES